MCVLLVARPVIQSALTCLKWLLRQKRGRKVNKYTHTRAFLRREERYSEAAGKCRQTLVQHLLRVIKPCWTCRSLANQIQMNRWESNLTPIGSSWTPPDPRTHTRHVCFHPGASDGQRASPGQEGPHTISVHINQKNKGFFVPVN